MCSLRFCVFFICVINIKFVILECEKSFVTICETVSDVAFNKTRKTWTELLIQHEKYDNIPPRYSLSKNELDRDLTNLRWLIVVKQITEIKKGAFTHLKNLQHLIFYGNDLEKIEDRTFVGFQDLSKLRMENNKVANLKPNAFLSSKIETVDLSHNKLSGLRSGVFRKCSVTELIITHNALSYIQKNSLPNTLKVLRLDYNIFGSWPDDLMNLKQLEEFTFSHNEVSDIFDFSELQNLKKLDLSFNQIESVAGEFDNLRFLKHLDLSSNELKRFVFTPQFVQNMGRRFSLFLAFNRLRNLDLQAVNTTIVTVTICGNPWNCNCLRQMEKVICKASATIIKTICDEKLFNGELPICVATGSRECEDDEVPNQEYTLFRNSCKSNSCNVFTDTDTNIS